MSELDGLKLLRRIEEGVAGKTGEAFFKQIVCDLARALNAHAAFTSRLLPGRRASMLAFWTDGAYEKCLEYALEGTPCEYVYRGEITSYARNVGEVFPVDRAWFEQLGVKSYLGIPVKDETGAVCGHLAVMDTRERDWADADVDVLRLFSLRSAAELERIRYQGDLEAANSALRQANERLEGEIAQRAAMEEQLAAAKNVAESANRAKSAFISQMSHELRTPLNGILGYAQLLQRENGGSGERLADGLGIIERSGEHLLKLVNDLLDLAKIEAGKLELTRDRVNLRELVEHVANLARVRAANAGLTLQVEMNADILADVVTDERVVRQILLNLLGNAVKFTEPGGRVTLRVLGEPMDSGHYRVRFTVEDSGIGIEAEELARIFEPFHRITSAERVVEGTGLGLPITQRLVAALGANLTVTSHRGAGSKFVVEIDFELAPAPQPAMISAAEIEGYSGNTRIVLVADDDHDNRALVSQLLESVGFLVQSVSNGFEAIQRVRSIRPDLIITDLVMPVVDGMELMRTLRAEQALNSIPVIAMSASASEYAREEALQAGCSGFISKPLRLTSLLEIVGAQLRLQWRYRASTAVRANEPLDLPAEPFQLDSELAGELQHLAMQGDILSLSARIEAALSGDDAARSFCAEIRALVAQYDMRGIRRMLTLSCSRRLS
jgi:signal transduction histidine kinase/CheY-like chemotaxis protein